MPTLDWLGREDAFRVAARVPTRVLRPHAAGHVFGAGDAGNLLVQGDNLEALAALLPFYRGRVKCVFIDPPYNTKSAFEHYDDRLEHSAWLSMMLPRLQLLREFLREDGSIWVTIDDNEGHYLKVLMDEVFGRGHFVANVVWQKKYTIANDTRTLSDNHDHVLFYARDASRWIPNKLPRSDAMNERYRNPDNHRRGPWKATPLHAKSGGEAGRAFSYTFSNGVVWRPPPGTYPRFSAATLADLDARDEIWFGKDGAAVPSRKTFLCDVAGGGVPAATLWLHTEAGNNHESKTEIAELDLPPFDTPKPERLLQRILHIASNPGDLVLDSFLGSGTTAAVAHKMGRRWIGIEMGEHAVTHCLPRLQKVVAGEQGGISAALGWAGGGGFRFLGLGAPLFDAAGDIHPEVRFADLAAFIWLRETGTALDPAALPPTLPLLGVHEGRAVYLLYNGILGDKRPAGGNVLTGAVLDALRALCWHAGPKLVYGEACRLGAARLAAADIEFKQLPHAVPR